MNVAIGSLLAFWLGCMIALAFWLVIGLMAERLNVRANRRINQQLAEFDAANPQFNEDHPEWNRK